MDVLELTLPGLLARAGEQFPERSAIHFMGREMNYAALTDQANKFAAALHEAGIGQGDRVAIMLPNCPQYVVAYYGILALGGIVVQVNPMSVEREVEHYLSDSGAKAIVVYGPLLPKVAGAPYSAKLAKQIVVEFTPEPHAYDNAAVRFEAFAAGATGDAPKPSITPDDIAVLQYTGGTTGRSKGAMLTHRNLVANAQQSNLLFGGDPDVPDRVLTALPLFHVYAMTVAMNTSVFSGWQMILLPRFNPEEVLQTIKATKPTLFPGAPTMYIALNAYPGAEDYGISSIRLCVSGSAPLPVEVMRSFESKTQGTIIEGYGLSEASPVTHFNPIDKRKPGSIGPSIALTESKIVDVGDPTRTLGPNEIGELLIRGPQIMKGYWNMADETAATLVDGWLLTGDIARMDEEGYFYIIDRKKDMIIAGGFNVYPRDVEEVLYQHPGVQEAVVVGVPDAYRGETVKAFIVLKQDAGVTEQELDAFCRERLSAYKTPHIYEFRAELPKTAAGKILRRMLREEG